jgi:hypothetical protein
VSIEHIAIITVVSTVVAIALFQYQWSRKRRDEDDE